jgi:hypothetical protein
MLKYYNANKIKSKRLNRKSRKMKGGINSNNNPYITDGTNWTKIPWVNFLEIISSKVPHTDKKYDITILYNKLINKIFNEQIKVFLKNYIVQ